MPIRYKLVQRRDFSRDAEEGSKLYYATLVTSGSVEFEELCESISEETAPYERGREELSRPSAESDRASPGGGTQRESG